MAVEAGSKCFHTNTGLLYPSSIGYRWVLVLFLCTRVAPQSSSDCTAICSRLNDFLGNQGDQYSYLILEQTSSTTSTNQLVLCSRSKDCRSKDCDVPMLSNETTNVFDPPSSISGVLPDCQQSLDEYYNGTVIRQANATRGIKVRNDSCSHACEVCKADMCARNTSMCTESSGNDIDTEILDCTRKELGLFSSESELETVLSSLNASLGNYMDLLDRTVRGVLITEDGVSKCQMRYTNWLCRTKLPLLFKSIDDQLMKLKPCLQVCWDVLVECPFYLPAQNQFTFLNGEKVAMEEQYAGDPAFNCPSEQWIKGHYSQSRYRTCDSLGMSYFLQNCI